MKIDKGTIYILAIICILVLWEGSSLLLDTYPERFINENASGKTSPNVLGYVILCILGAITYCVASVIALMKTKRRILSPIVITFSLFLSILFVFLKLISLRSLS